MLHLSPDALATAADENFAVHAGWAAARTPGMKVERDRELLVVDSGQPCDTFNIVGCARLDASTARAKATEVMAAFARARRPFSWWVGPADRPRDLGETLSALGLPAAESERAMVLDLDALVVPAEVAGLELRRVATGEDLEAFAAVQAANWSPPDPEVLRFYERVTKALLDPEAPLRLYVALLDGRAVAAAEVTVAGGVAGVYNVATLAAFRRRGIAAALTAHGLLAARDDTTDGGHRVPVAVLQASADGGGVYERLGFLDYGTVTEHKPHGP